jgi:hypothetical protein
MPSFLEHAVVELSDGRILSGVAEPLLDDFAATGTTLLYCYGGAISRRLGPSISGRDNTGRAAAIASFPAARIISRSSSLRPKTVPVDKGPIDLKTEAGPIAKVQVTIAEHRVLAKEAIRQRIGLRPTM